MKELLSGNQAIAQGAWEAGVVLAAGYPGTPSTEILENLCTYQGVYSEWAPNEKVALEVGIGAAMTGARVLVTTKHVGLNVAADPLMTLAYTGVNGGLVIVCADDPGMHSSQNEQDNRYLARFAKVPVLEPSDSQEAKDMIALGLEISENYDTPVILRVTTRICHSQTLVEKGTRTEYELKSYKKDPRKNLMVPAFGRMRRVDLEGRLRKLEEYAEKTPVNNIIEGNNVGVITSGISYQYVREVLPGATVLKLGLTNPLPVQKIRDFAARVDRLIVVEELEPYLEEQLRCLGLSVEGKSLFPVTGELSPGLVRGGMIKAGLIEGDVTTAAPSVDPPPAAPPRPPVLCAGCPHRGVFYTLRRLKLVVTGDIGCYTLGGLPPLEGMDTCVCMGASIGMAHGIDKAVPGLKGRTVAVIGDSTFMHSGITGLANVVANRGDATVIILDNRTTAMTGHQNHPGTGKNLMGEEAPEINLEQLCRALGVPRVTVVDPLDLTRLTEVIKEELAAPGPSVIIAQRPCVLLKREAKPAVQVDPEACEGCKTCLRLSCPAISMQDKKVVVNTLACIGCNLCPQVCKFGALKGGEDNA